MDHLRQFRQLDSKTPVHPEYGPTPGVECTTGPMGRGLANAVDLAIALKHLATRYNRPGFDVFDYHIYGTCNGGDLVEGATAEACSLAGHLQLGNIIFFYDDNHSCIERNTDLAFTEDIGKRFEAYGWHVQTLTDVNDLPALSLAVVSAKAEARRPSLILVRSLVAYRSQNKGGTAVVPDEVLQFYRKAGAKGGDLQSKWTNLFAKYRKEYPAFAEEYELAAAGKLPKDWEKMLPVLRLARLAGQCVAKSKV